MMATSFFILVCVLSIVLTFIDMPQSRLGKALREDELRNEGYNEGYAEAIAERFPHAEADFEYLKRMIDIAESSMKYSEHDTATEFCPADVMRHEMAWEYLEAMEQGYVKHASAEDL
jgi:hypothetical protein